MIHEELLSSICRSVKLNKKPKFIYPLHVAIQSSGKLRLTLVLSFFTSFFMKKPCKYEDLTEWSYNFLKKGNFVLAFDLNSAYHNI